MKRIAFFYSYDLSWCEMDFMGQHYGLVRGIHEECESRYLAITSFDNRSDWRPFLKTGEWKAFDGFVGAVSIFHPEQVAVWRELSKKKPGVLVTHSPLDPDSHFVGVDEAAGTEALARFFKDQGLRRTAFLAAVDTPWTRSRLSFFRSAVRAEGLEIEESWTGTGLAGGGTSLNTTTFKREDEVKLARKIFDRLPMERRPQALAFYSDNMAGDFWKWATERGLSIPKDLSITGWNDLPIQIAPYGRNVLTTLREDFEEMGRAGVRVLDEILKARRPGIKERLALAPELVVRLSTPPLLSKSGKLEDAVFLKEVRGFLERHVGSPKKLEELPGILELSRPYFLIKFKRVFGSDFTTYLRDIRIRRACELLRASAHPIARIQLEVGYETHQSFNRAFREVMGAHPTEYRESFQRTSVAPKITRK